MIREVIFDLDGTLIDSLNVIIKIGTEMAEKYGIKPLNEEKIKELMKLPIKERIEELGIPLIKVPKLGIELLQKYNKYAAQFRPVEGVKDMLFVLHNLGYRLNIVSSNSVQNIKAFLNANDLNIFNNIQSSKGLFGKHLTINKLVSKLNVKKDEVIYIGDEQRDIEACRKIGIPVIAVLWGFDSSELIEKMSPDYMVSRPNEIVAIIKDI